MASTIDPSGVVPIPLRNEDFSRSVNALFDTRAHAETAREDLIAAGIHGDDIALIGESEVSAILPDGDTGTSGSGGFWETLKELFMPEDDRNQFAEGVRRGGTTVSVRTDTANHDRVIDILDRDGAIDLDERQESWVNEGWTGYTAKDPLIETRGTGHDLRPDDEDMSYAPASAGTAGFAASDALRFPVGEEAAPPVESPGALPTSSLQGETQPPAMGGGDRIGGSVRELGHGRRRIRSYQWTAGTTPTDAENL